TTVNQLIIITLDYAYNCYLFYFDGSFFQRAKAAFLAIAFRLRGDKRSARTFPPFNPPSRPKATAAGFFCGSSGFGENGSPIASSMIWRAKRFGSDGRFGLLERLGILSVCHIVSTVTP